MCSSTVISLLWNGVGKYAGSGVGRHLRLPGTELRSRCNADGRPAGKVNKCSMCCVRNARHHNSCCVIRSSLKKAYKLVCDNHRTLERFKKSNNGIKRSNPHIQGLNEGLCRYSQCVRSSILSLCVDDLIDHFAAGFSSLNSPGRRTLQTAHSQYIV
jgi:hypothetical protein